MSYCYGLSVVNSHLLVGAALILTEHSVSDTELLATLFELGREVTSVLNLDDLLQKIPQLIARLTPFTIFPLYLGDEKRGDLRTAYAAG